jgi:hypothetical protein
MVGAKIVHQADTFLQINTRKEESEIPYEQHKGITKASIRTTILFFIILYKNVKKKNIGFLLLSHQVPASFLPGKEYENADA